MCQLQEFLKQEYSLAVAMVHIQVETLMANCKGLSLKAEEKNFPPANVDPRHDKGQGTGKILC